MIPVRIEVEGFLCYRDKRVIDLERSDLWVLSGRNGSGKSAVFDAMTYALFKAHRGGKYGAANLIHSDENGFSITFDFDLGPERYRLRRSLRKGTGGSDCQLFRRDPQAEGQWPAVPETNKDKKLEAWIDANIGLSFETFTASVLLMQGQAEKLIGTQPGERHAILAGIVNLAKYQKMFDVADRKRLARKAERDTAQQSLRECEEIALEAVDRVEELLTLTARKHVEAKQEWEASVGALSQAAAWRESSDKKLAAEARCRRAQDILHQSARIRRDSERLEDLEAVLPQLRGAIQRRAKLAGNAREGADLKSELSILGRKLQQIAGLAEDNRRHHSTLEENSRRDRIRQDEVTEQGKQLHEAVERAKARRAQKEKVEGLDAAIAEYPADLAEAIASLKGSVEEGVRWREALPTLKNFVRDRTAFRAEREKADEARRELEKTQGSLPSVRAASETLTSQLVDVEAGERSAQEQLTKVTTLQDLYSRRLEQFVELRDAAECDRCGRPLTPEHYKAELTRLEGESARLSLEASAARKDHEGRRTDLASIFANSKDARAALQRAESALERRGRELDLAEQQLRTREAQCRDNYESLSEAFRLRVAPAAPGDWAETVFPSADEIAEGQNCADESRREEESLGRMKHDLGSLSVLQGQRAQEAASLANLVLEPGDELAESRRQALCVEYLALKGSLGEIETQKALAQATIELLDTHRAALNNHRAEVDKKLAVSETEATNARAEDDRVKAGLPVCWQGLWADLTDDQISGWTAEAQALRSRGVEGLARELSHANLELDQAKSQVEELTREIDRFPVEHQLTAEAAERQQQGAYTRLQTADNDLRHAQGKLTDLEQQRRRREDLSTKAQVAQERFLVAETLAHLLGRKELQRELIREAEHGIIERANPTLGDISGGELQLRLVEADGEDDQALALEALVRTHGETRVHDVAFLSGSQKFRVAVSLALAIGQYARGKKERPIESVVIDEGFGCLDRQGRDEMIAQFKALRGRLARVILVSHQEDFAEAFDDGYRFDVVDGSTVVEPFHK